MHIQPASQPDRQTDRQGYTDLWGHKLRHEKHVVQKGSVVSRGLAVVDARHHPPVDRFVFRTAVADKTATQFEACMSIQTPRRGERDGEWAREVIYAEPKSLNLHFRITVFTVGCSGGCKYVISITTYTTAQLVSH